MMIRKFLLIGIALTFFTSCSQSEQKESQTSTRLLKISTSQDPESLDPRLIRDLPSVTFLRMFFDGLMHYDSSGHLVPALAEKIGISPDMTRYTFTLKDSQWSNGEPLTAHDFEYAWKSILTPDFPAPNAYQFYVIKGAKNAKEGQAPLAEVGIKALDDKTLVVDLENPTPYFLELIAFHAFLPINKQWDLQKGAQLDPSTLISNGPFRPKTWAHNNILIATKNPLYWDASSVKIDELQLMTLDPHTALEMFDADALDWTGSPLSTLPPDAVASLRKLDTLKIAPAAGVHFFRLNTEKLPFSNQKMRQAFAYALNRQAITDHILQGGQSPALAVVPTYMGLEPTIDYQDHQLIVALKLFNEALDELGLTKEELPPIALSYTNSDRSHKIAQAVQQQWNSAFGISVQLEGSENKVYYDKLKQKNYQISSGSWFADINDPINFLEVFKYKSNATNNTQWENPEYVALLDQSSKELNPEKRRELMSQAETVLIQQMPVIPLFYSTFNYVIKKNVHRIYFSELGYLDFTHSFINE